jgi:hypothetical protein
VCTVSKEVVGQHFEGFEKKKEMLVGGDLCNEVFSDEEDQEKLNQLLNS